MFLIILTVFFSETCKATKIDTDFPGNDIGTPITGVIDMDACQMECEKTSLCRGNLPANSKNLIGNRLEKNLEKIFFTVKLRLNGSAY